ncbi:DUF1351 domain-containing protein [Ligilactobacillus aviarius]|uniref:DUF1351 domain-containing protein n=1 Tax=Ligilactobacillus aviarius TaxID=1606 RepID=UPI0024BB1477|nr:DUF1351 domain-containing protein [Ligilactobacillus aviarius]
MTNELAETTISVEMQTPEIKITNKEKLDALVDAVVRKYSGIVVTEDTLKECKKTLTELRKLSKELNAKRLEKQCQYETPVKEFKAQIDAYINQINDVISDIKQGTDEFEEKRKAEKQIAIQNLIDEMAGNYDVDPETVEFDKKWLNKSTTMKKITEDIANQMKEKQRLDDDWKIVKKYAQDKGLLADHYQTYIGVFSAFDIEKMIDEDADKKAEQDRNQAEELMFAKAIDEETGEIKQAIQQVTFTIKGTEEQLNQVAAYLKNSGVEIVSASNRETVIGG